MKFAYLIMAHNNISQLEKLLRFLDDENNDIYLHVDLKCNADIQALKNCVKKSAMKVYRKYDVMWGDLSQPKLELFLLKKATQTYHDYYHLLSGADLPLKTNSEIQAFFTEHSGKEFIHFESDAYCKKENCTLYHFFAKRIKKAKHGFCRKFYTNLENFSLSVQKKLKVSRKFYCGANWFSITHGLAVDLSNNGKKMLKKLRFSICCDEYLLQTFVKTYAKNAIDVFSYATDDYHSIAREIDWARGNPYVWRESDYSFLIDSPAMFARKVDENKDSVIIDRIYEYLRSKSR